jgi:hypothetical protein
MNERIEKLMGQTLDEKFAGTWSVMDLQDLTKFADRFAELVISECCEAFWTEECSYSDLAYEEYTKRVNTIKQHFGVE